jgi:hypothetical protein
MGLTGILCRMPPITLATLVNSSKEMDKIPNVGITEDMVGTFVASMQSRAYNTQPKETP